MAEHSIVRIDSRKWPDRRHWQFEARRLGEDRHGVWLYVPAGTVAQRGDEPPHPILSGFVSLVPPAAWWIVQFLRTDPRYEVYVNIGTPPRWDGDVQTQIDLDLDVVRTVAGEVLIVDENEFDDHRVRYGYPDRIVAAARTAAAAAVIALERRDEPFGSVVDRWWGMADAR
jgi:predicted RNA-binding protein associated with RNAse of E/G family